MNRIKNEAPWTTITPTTTRKTIDKVMVPCPYAFLLNISATRPDVQYSERQDLLLLCLHDRLSASSEFTTLTEIRTRPEDGR
jgi:hypothetical protein